MSAPAPELTRRHFVFLNPCGRPLGLAEQTGRCKTVDDAWTAMYDSRAEERAAHARGVRAVYVDHATYERDLYPLMAKACTHGGNR